MKSGLGDMLAKYVSICEWRIAHIIVGEYFCEEIAALIRNALQRCVDSADGLLRREECAVQSVFEGLVIGGIAMNYAGLSRPASGVEHYISHILDMRGAAFGTPVELHGIQCAVGTLLAIRMYEKLLQVKPDVHSALEHAESFDLQSWHAQLREFLGSAAESMIDLETREKKYEPAAHRRRLSVITQNWEMICSIIREELPSSKEIERLLQRMEAPASLAEIGTDNSLLPAIFKATRDIRDKYVLSRLAWDLNVTDSLLST